MGMLVCKTFNDGQLTLLETSFDLSCSAGLIIVNLTNDDCHHKFWKGERDSRWYLRVFYSLFQTWSNIAYKSGIQCPTAGCSTWYLTHIEICKQCNINNTLNTKLHYSIEIKMLQSGVFWAMSLLGAELSPQLQHIVITVAEAEPDFCLQWVFMFSLASSFKIQKSWSVVF